jgi:hypothetical protein
MDLERTLPSDLCDIVSSAGELIAKTKAAILPENIVVFDVKIPINVGDEVRRKLPSGQDEVFEVTDPTFFKEFHGTKAHYQIKYRRKGTFKHGQGGNYTFHVSGNNARVNVESRDQSTNVVIEGDVFGNLTAALKNGVKDEAQLGQLLAAVEEMRRTRDDKSSFASAYQKFVSICADHLGIVMPFLPALTNLLQ